MLLTLEDWRHITIQSLPVTKDNQITLKSSFVFSTQLSITFNRELYPEKLKFVSKEIWAQWEVKKEGSKNGYDEENQYNRSI